MLARNALSRICSGSMEHLLLLSTGMNGALDSFSESNVNRNFCSSTVLSQMIVIIIILFHLWTEYAIMTRMSGLAIAFIKVGFD